MNMLIMNNDVAFLHKIVQQKLKLSTISFSTVLEPSNFCVYDGLQIDEGDSFRPANIANVNYEGNSTRTECIECTCRVN